MLRISLFVAGIVIIMLAVYRHMAKRRQFGESYTEYIKKKKLPPLRESKEFGQNIKWVIEPHERQEEPDPGSSEPPTGEGG
ncbi:hypothetical protein ACFLQK_02890 [bacterium]